MSALNGDKARYQRLRKAGLRRRERSRLAQVTMRAAAARLQLAAPEPASPEDTAQERSAE